MNLKLNFYKVHYDMVLSYVTLVLFDAYVYRFDGIVYPVILLTILSKTVICSMFKTLSFKFMFYNMNLIFQPKTIDKTKT